MVYPNFKLTQNDSSMKQRQSRTLFSRPWLSLFQFLGVSLILILWSLTVWRFEKPLGIKTSSLILYFLLTVWFHIADDIGSEEPEQESFWASHSAETSPRSYKIIVPMNSFSMNQIYIRPWDKALAVEGDYTGSAKLEETFTWYSAKFRWKSLKITFKDSVLCWFITWIQLWGTIQDLFTSIGSKFSSNPK